MPNKTAQPSKIFCQSALYQMVFRNTYVKYGVLFILVFLLLQPIAPAFAAATSTSNMTTNDTQPPVDSASLTTVADDPVPIETSKTEQDQQMPQQVTGSIASTATETNAGTAATQQVEPVQDNEQKNSSSTASQKNTVAQDIVATFSIATSSNELSTADVAASTTAVEKSSTSSTASTSTTTKKEQINKPSTDTVSVGSSTSTLYDPETHITSTSSTSSLSVSGLVETQTVPASNTDAYTPTEEQTATGTQESSVDISNAQASSTLIVGNATTSSSTPWTLVEHNSGTYTFGKEECANVGDGSFYCSTPQETSAFTTDGVFAAPDANGDREIFARVDGKQVQITNNNTDDAAPYYDPHSNRIVWQQSIHDRYQIISDDLNTGEVKQLTSTSYNNMQPVAYGDITLWQAWIGNNWEIMESDGAVTTQLTHSPENDVAPQIRGDYIVWQTQFTEGWEIAVYDRGTKHTNYIKADSSGTTAENPRFVLVYDSVDIQGDMRVVGYDPVKMTSFILQQVPVSVPKKLPDPDQTGQTRALLQNKSSLRDGELENLNATPASGNGTPNPLPTATPQTGTLDLHATSSAPITSAGTTTAATSTQAYTLDLSTASSTSTGTTHGTTTTKLVNIVTIQQQKFATSTSDIPDVVIPPKTASNSPEIR